MTNAHNGPAARHESCRVVRKVRERMRESVQRRRSARGVALVLATLTLFVFVPMVGLAIDGGIAYLLKSKLSQAVDAACLAGARSLNRGADISSQQANAVAVALKMFQVNMKQGTWASVVATPDIQVTEDAGTHMRYVTITATLTAPLYFLRLVGKETVTLSVRGQARRRDVNIVLILDRSSSILNRAGSAPGPHAIDDMKAAARSFVSNFSAGRDYLGLVVFGGHEIVAFPLANNFTTASPTLDTIISQIAGGSNTGSAQALAIAYQQLTSNLAVTRGALNVIVFFTDGLANGISADFSPVLTTACKGAGAPAIGWIAQWSGFAPTGTVAGIFKNQARSASNATNDLIAAPGTCKFSTDATKAPQDITRIPSSDMYGNATSGADSYHPEVDLTKIYSPQQIGYASANAADFAARHMRDGSINTEIVPLIYCIGLFGGGEEPDRVFLKRVANTTDSPIYDNTKPTGLLVEAEDSVDLQRAFLRVASEILRLGQ